MRAILYFTFATAVAAAIPSERTAVLSETNAPRLLDLCVERPTGVTGYWYPEKSDLAEVGAGIDEFLELTWSLIGVAEKRRIDWKHYYLQIGGMIKDGRRMLFLSYAWAPDIADKGAQAKAKKESDARGKSFDAHWWKTKPILVRDGGWAVFRVIYDPRAKRFVWYDQNLPSEKMPNKAPEPTPGAVTPRAT